MDKKQNKSSQVQNTIYAYIRFNGKYLPLRNEVDRLCKNIQEAINAFRKQCMPFLVDVFNKDFKSIKIGSTTD